MLYTSIANLEAYLLITIEAYFQPKVEQWIESVSRSMDGVADRTLVANAIGSGEDFEEMYYDGHGRAFITIDDCQEITKVEVGDQYGESLAEVTDYIKYPKIAPYRRLILKSGSFSCGVQNVRVEGRFGLFDAIPKDIEFACTVLVAGIINEQNGGPKSIKSEKYLDYAVSYADEKGIDDFQEAIAIIERYRKISF